MKPEIIVGLLLCLFGVALIVEAAFHERKAEKEDDRVRLARAIGVYRERSRR